MSRSWPTSRTSSIAPASSSAGTTGVPARPTYEVRKKAEADYHLIQFRGENELLEQLDHNLKITDGVLRHRIIKLRPGTPDPPDLRPSATAATPERRRAAAAEPQSQPWIRPIPSSASARTAWPAIATAFERAWAARVDDFDACIAAHYLARVQPDAQATFEWNARALEHARLVDPSACAASCRRCT